MSRAIVFSMLLVFAGSDPVLAQEDDFSRNGIYVSADMAGTWYSEVKDDVKNDLAAAGFMNGTVALENPLGLGVRTGFRFHPHFAGEAQFQWFANATVDYTDEQSNIDAIKFESLAISANAKAYLLTGRVQPFVLAGAGLLHVNGKDKLSLGTTTEGDAFAARFGGGIEFYLNENFVVAVEGDYLLPTGSLDGYDQVIWSAGLQYRF